MRIDTVAIDGFGQFHGAQLSPAPSLTVVRGPNEAGKTTLLAFTRAMLFGFPRGGGYPALNGGKRGGWLDVVMDDGRALRIERYGDRGGDGRLRVIEADKDLGPGHLAAVLQGVETSVYQNIFAFGLGELTRFETLKDDEVAARIYGAGLGTGGVSGLKVEQSLHEHMEGWFKSGGSKPRLNVLLKRLEEIDRELDGRDLPRAYAEAGTRLEAVKDQLAELGKGYDVLDAELRRQQQIKDGWKTWLDLRRAQEERAELGDVLAFDPDILERLTALETTLADSERAVEAATRDCERAQTKLDDAAVDAPTLARREELEALSEATGIEAARADERARTDHELNETRAVVDAALSNLGTGWTIERVETFDDSIAVKSEISGHFRASLAKAEQALTSARDVHDTAEEQSAQATDRAKAATSHVAELDEELADRPPSMVQEHTLRELERLSDQLAAQRGIAADTPDEDLAAKRATLDERRARAADLDDALRSRQTANETLPGLRALDQSATNQAQRQYLPPVALGIGGIVVAVVLALMDVTMAASVVVAVVGVGGAAAWVAFLRQQGSTADAGVLKQLEQRSKEAEATIGQLGPELDLGSSPSTADVVRYTDELDAERRELERAEDRQKRAQTAQEEVDRLGAELGAVAATAGLPGSPSDMDLEAFRRTVAADRGKEAAREAAVEREAQLKTAAESQAKRVADLATALDKRNEEAAAARSEWEEWLEEHGLDRSYDRETAARVVDSVTVAKGTVAALRKAEGRSEALALELAAYVEQVDALRPLLSDSGDNDDDAAAVAVLLSRQLANAMAGERERDDLARALEDKSSLLTVVIESRDAARSDLDRLLEGAAVEDAPILRSEVERSRQAATLDSEAAAARAALTTLSGPGKALEEFIVDLDAVEDITDVDAEVSRITGVLGDLDDERDLLNQEAGGSSTSREEMESDVAATELRQEREDLLSQLDAGARSWSVLALAHEILNRSRSVYEEAHRPAVIEKAEYFFKAWTDGRYRRIIAPLGEDVRSIERRDGVEVGLSGLSRGTSEQLYLALRFGLVQHFVETSGEPLPIVMDDILVNFDADRAERAARSIEELAETCQIIYFTCHDSTPLEAELEQPLPRIEVN